MYQYRAKVARIIDADTVAFDIDLGFGVWRMNESCRLFGINAPEVVGENKAAGIAAKEALASKMPVGLLVTISTFKDNKEKYGRFLVLVHDKSENINEWLVANGHAAYATFKSKPVS